MKAYTDLEQSKRLAEILPLESADMSWVSNGLGNPFARTIPIKGDPEELCACWSLAALLGILPQGTRILKSSTNYTYHCDCPKENIDKWFDNPVDACVELIVKLN